MIAIVQGTALLPSQGCRHHHTAHYMATCEHVVRLQHAKKAPWYGTSAAFGRCWIPAGSGSQVRAAMYANHRAADSFNSVRCTPPRIQCDLPSSPLHASPTRVTPLVVVRRSVICCFSHRPYGYTLNADGVMSALSESDAAAKKDSRSACMAARKATSVWFPGI